ncbi:YdeI/OmpD-associated family protein [Reichenbachiella agarivorans]|uniref:YdeI/OmpD-associated family protein n=1 Tax=Reichenbachiella agarivorans TaxID=2979464 RepID=A0ABY6CNS8_9BACT|nr:YdeI/OmpD-associated family protein [Reichenbachiella agarivorans]UXP31690.1 YdeI/OmpD-associated family protein [Reichenbachiella agarivorans]
MKNRPELYFENDTAWREWLSQNHDQADGAYLIFYRVTSEQPSMRWEEAVRVALCYGWIDSTVKKIDEDKRRQLFTPRKAKSAWSKINKTHITELIELGLMHESGLKVIENAKEDGTWTSLDDVEELTMPDDLQAAFETNPIAYSHYEAFSRSYRKSYLYWLNSAKRQETRDKRITEIIRLCQANVKSRT